MRTSNEQTRTNELQEVALVQRGAPEKEIACERGYIRAPAQAEKFGSVIGHRANYFLALSKLI